MLSALVFYLSFSPGSGSCFPETVLREADEGLRPHPVKSLAHLRLLASLGPAGHSFLLETFPGAPISLIPLVFLGPHQLLLLSIPH